MEKEKKRKKLQQRFTREKFTEGKKKKFTRPHSRKHWSTLGF